MKATRPDFLPKVLPSGYSEETITEDGARYIYQGMRGYHTVILSGATELDGRVWLHLSVATPTKLPSWELLKFVKDCFLGPKRQAIQVLPSEERYINQHPYCLHLFTCISDDDPIPDFTHGGSSL